MTVLDYGLSLSFGNGFIIHYFSQLESGSFRLLALLPEMGLVYT